MTQTFGYYCDECRRKYVNHKCKDGLPCAHDINEAIFIHAKHYSHCETVFMQVGDTVILDASIFRKPKHEQVTGHNLLWNHTLEAGGPGVDLGEWIKKQDGKTLRAFEARWDSNDRIPQWRLFEQWPDYLNKEPQP